MLDVIKTNQHKMYLLVQKATSTILLVASREMVHPLRLYTREYRPSVRIHPPLC
jgi:hypothetical protein